MTGKQTELNRKKKGYTVDYKNRKRCPQKMQSLKGSVLVIHLRVSIVKRFLT